MPSQRFGNPGTHRILNAIATSIAANTLNLNGAFTLNSAGPGFAAQVVPDVSGQVEEIAVVADGFVGTWSLTDTEISVWVCESSSTNLRPGAVLTNGGPHSIPVGTGAGWKFLEIPAGSRPTVQAGSTYWIVVGDPDGDASNYLRLQTGAGLGDYGSTTGATTSNGFSSAGTGLPSSKPPNFAVRIGGVWYYGNVFVAMNTRTSSTNPVGPKIRLLQPHNLVGVAIFSEWALLGERFSVFTPSQTPPSGQTYDFPAVSAPAHYNQTGYGYRPFAPSLLQANQDYYLVIRKAAASTTPRELTLGAGANAAIRAGMPLGGVGKMVEWNGSAWVEYDNLASAIFPHLVPVAGGGGGGSPRMRAGTGVIG